MGHTVELNRDGEPRGPPVDPLIGRLLLHYRVLEVIGQGGMSVVYRGRDEHLARDVAIKVLHPFLREKPECRTRLAREARAVARLEHPHIVKVFDFSGDKDGSVDGGASRDHADGFIIAELVRGQTFKRHVEQHKLWQVPEVGAMAVWQLALALQHAHDNGIVHRDLKPENVMVRDDGALKLMDFGIAQIADQSGLTVTGTLLGSPAHMAPECIDGHAADERSDIFSLGTVLYWAATGHLPFEALTPHALLKLIVDGKAAPAQQKSARVSDDLARVIHKSMATKPADRFASARDFATALEEVLEKSGLPASGSFLRQVLAAPSSELPSCAARVRAAFLARAQKNLDEGATARALSCLNRVLGDDSADKDARALLDRLDADDVESDEEAATPVAANVDQAAIDTDVTALLAAPPATMSSAPPSLVWQRVGVAGVAVGLVVAAVFIARAVDRAAVEVQPETTPPTLAQADPLDDGVSHGAPSINAVDDVDNQKKKKKTKLATLPATTQVLLERHATLPPPTLPPTTTTPTTANSSSEKRRVMFRTSPWADIVVDGVVLATGTYAFEAQLVPGEHSVAFRNPQAKEHSQSFVVAKDGPPLEIAARLEPKPANLSVHCNVGDAFVVVGGGTGKNAAESVDRPLVVALGKDSKARREVYIYKKGYFPYKKSHVFAAGETTSLDVVLEPDAGDADVPSPAPAPAPPILGGPPTP